MQCTYCANLVVVFLVQKQSLDSKQEKYREQVRQMLTEFQISAGTEQQTQEENSGLMADLSTTSLPDIRESDESRESSVPRNEEGEEEGAEGRGKGGGGERAKEEDVMMTEIVSYDSEPRTHRASADGGVRRRVGVVERPQVVVVGGDEDPASVAAATTSRPPARPRSATTHTETSRERLGSDKSRSRRGHANTGPGVDTPTSPTQPRPHRKRPPVKELQIKPVQSKPSAAAQKLVESKREKGIKTDGASEGGRKEEEEKDGDAVGVQNGGGNEEKHSGGGKLEVRGPRVSECVWPGFQCVTPLCRVPLHGMNTAKAFNRWAHYRYTCTVKRVNVWPLNLHVYTVHSPLN